MTKDEAVILLCEHFSEGMVRTIVDAIAKDEALEKKDEPVALVAEVHISRYTIEWTNGPLPQGTKLYTTPQRTCVRLTKEEINEGLLRSFYVLEKARAWRDGVAWAEEILKEKNNAI